MLYTFVTTGPETADEAFRRNHTRGIIWYGFILLVTGMFGMTMLKAGPNFSPVAWIIYTTLAVFIFREPRYGVYTLVLFGLFADIAMMGWYPVVKNFSSGESLMYLHDALILSPLELTLVLTLMSWLGGMIMRRKLEFYTGELFWPAIIFIFFVTIGLVYGIGTRGNINIALWETRVMYYLPIMLVLTSNLITTRRHMNVLYWMAATGIFLQGLYGVYHFLYVLHGEISRIESIIEHAAAIRMNTLFVLAITAHMFKGSLAKRILLPLMSLPTFVPYVVAQRRAAFMTLGIALVVIFVVMYFVNRRWFWRLAPPCAFVAVAYLGAFWNNQGPMGLPARAVKGVISDDSGNEQENSSSVYRLIENVNNMYTIRQKPITGVGYGQKFYIIMQLPDISFFAWWEYIVHNSIMWMWMKGGLGTYYSMLIMIGSALMTGVRAFWRMPGKDMSAITLTGLLYILMHFVYAYVDMSWDAQSMLYVGMTMGALNCAERVAAQPIPLEERRYPWQPAPEPAPGLRPFPQAAG